MSEGRGARDALEADGVVGVGDAVEITPARAGRKLEVGHAAGTRPEKMPCSLDGRAGRSSAAAAGDTQSSRRSKMTRSGLGPEPDSFAHLPVGFVGLSCWWI